MLVGNRPISGKFLKAARAGATALANHFIPTQITGLESKTIFFNAPIIPSAEKHQSIGPFLDVYRSRRATPMADAWEKRLLAFERLACILLIGWLQFVGIYGHSIVHHILHAAPVAVLLMVPLSPARHFTGLMAGFLWVFMLGVVSPMLYDSLIRGYLLTRPEIPYTWLAPVAALIAATWAAANFTLLARRHRWFAPAILTAIGLIFLLAAIHPYFSMAFEYPLEQTLAGHYAWGAVLLLETAIVLAVPGWTAFRLSPDLRLSASFVRWQMAYWVFFVGAMVAGLLPVFNR